MALTLKDLEAVEGLVAKSASLVSGSINRSHDELMNRLIAAELRLDSRIGDAVERLDSTADADDDS